MSNVPETLTWIVPRSIRERVTLQVATKLFYYSFRSAFLVSGVVALLLGFAIGNVPHAMKMAAIMWLIVSTFYVTFFTLLSFIGYYAPKRIEVDPHAITVVHTLKREYLIDRIEQLEISEQGPSIRTLSFVRKVRDVSINVVIGIAPEVDLDRLRDLLHIRVAE